MQAPEPATELARFRAALYAAGLGRRKDSLFETLDAVLTGAGPETLARLSLAPSFRRRWASVPDGLAAGQVHVEAVRALLVGALPPEPARDLCRPLWVADGTTWPRPEARTSPERTYCRRVAAGVPQGGMVAGWEYQWLVAVPEAQGSWVLPLDVARRPPPAAPPAPLSAPATPTALAIRQLRAVLAGCPAAAPRPVVALDSGYDPVALARAQREPAGLGADGLVRLATHRVLYRAPVPYAGRGRPRTHGPVFRFKDPATCGPPDRAAAIEHPEYGTVVVRAWAGLHVRHAPDLPFTVVQVQVSRLPRRAQPPAPLWLAWLGGALPEDLLLLWRWYLRRFTVEHGLRFAKQALGWTTVRPRAPAAADRWTWLVALALWHLWLARPLVTARCLPWEAPQPSHRLSPGRVRRAFAGLFVQVGTPARPPKPRGKSPGRRRGQAPGPRPRCAVLRRTPKQTRRRGRHRASDP